MWDENAPLELLKDMPKVLSVENLAKIQEVIDKDKYINSYEMGCDLCGRYAPFCGGCDKNVQYPCAVAFVKMAHESGMEVEIEEIPYLNQPVQEEKKPSGRRIRIAIARRKVQ